MSRLDKSHIFKPSSRKLSEEEFKKIWKHFEETGDIEIAPTKNYMELCKKNPELIRSYQGDIPLDEFYKRLVNGEYDE